jgi:hypothetical protein
MDCSSGMSGTLGKVTLGTWGYMGRISEMTGTMGTWRYMGISSGMPGTLGTLGTWQYMDCGSVISGTRDARYSVLCMEGFTS